MTLDNLTEQSHPYDQKFYLESLLHRDPANFGLQDAYFRYLMALSRSGFGLMHANLPGYDHPIFFRGMTSDILNMHQIFRHREYGFDIVPAPQRILDLGAYVGYAAVYLANRYPNAEIVCVEPSRTNFRILCLNTLPNANVRRVHGAAWSKSSRLNLIDRVGGDWGTVFGEEAGSSGEAAQGYTVPHLLSLAGWPNAQYVKCDIEGAELELFSDPAADDWLSAVSCVSVETHDRFKPGCTQAVESALPQEQFEHSRSGEFHVFRRISAGVCARDDSNSSEMILLTPDTLRLRRFDRVGVAPANWGFCVIDGDTFQLHPNPPGHETAELRFHLNLSGQRLFSAQCHLGERSQGPVIFSVRLSRNDRTAFDEGTTVLPGESASLRFDIPERVGPCQLVLATEMAPAATSNGYAWARWTHACLQ